MIRIPASIQNFEWRYFLRELTLIIMGIWIALAINNWQQRREETRKELFILRELRENLAADLGELYAIRAQQFQSQRAAMSLLNHFLSKKPWHDSLSNLLVNAGNYYPFHPRRATFESMKTLGPTLLKNDYLRATLFRVYEERLDVLQTDLDMLMRRSETFWIPTIADKVTPIRPYVLAPINYAEMLNDPRVSSAAMLLWSDNRRLVLNASSAIIDTELLIRQIDREIRNIEQGRSRALAPVEKTLTLQGYPEAQTITVAGDFNRWDTTQCPMTRAADGWSATITLKPGLYMYKFVVDGQWIEDPANPDTLRNEYGTLNSVMLVE